MEERRVLRRVLGLSSHVRAPPDELVGPIQASSEIRVILRRLGSQIVSCMVRLMENIIRLVETIEQIMVRNVLEKVGIEFLETRAFWYFL